MMNIQDQLGELFIVGFQGSEINEDSDFGQQLKYGRPGGVILFDRSLCHPEKGGNIQTPEQLKELNTRLRRVGPAELLICVDQEGGLVQRLNSRNGFTDTRSAEEMGSSGTLELTRSQALLTARMLHQCQINVNFAPVVDLNINRDNPIIGRVKRSFSSDPDLVTRCADVWIECHKTYNILSCLKHFPGHGSSADDSHLGFVDISDSWSDRELIPYRTLISRNHVDMVMVGHLFNNSIDPQFPATLSPATITGMLRDKLGYKGVVVTDDMQMKAITDRWKFGEALCQSLMSGIDMIVIGNNLDHRPGLLNEAINAVRKGVESGKLDEERIAAALTRIRRLKQSFKDKQ